MKPMLGTYHPLAQWASAACPRSHSFLDKRWNDPDLWRAQARGTVVELLAYDPPSVPLDSRVEETTERDGIVTERVSWAQPFGPRTEAFLLKPAGAAGRTGRLPGVIALHCHAGFYYYGKEKIAAIPNEPSLLQKLKKDEYEGVSWANELARRGYAVLVPDSFLWGSRRLDPGSVPPEQAGNASRGAPGTDEAIANYNAFVGGYETMIAKTLFLSGTTWPGIMAWEDRRAVDYLVTRSDVDAARLGCGGLSGGGLRTTYLAALDPRITAAACAGFMTTHDEMPEMAVSRHTWMFHVPHLAGVMDFPDVAALHGPLPLMVQYDIDDPLFTLEGQKKADRLLRAVYERMGAAPERYQGRFYPGPHKFDRAMQKDAFDFFDRWLK
jgi:dienelactone hydrolase